eukprot:scaffold42707_cov60-Phaeocystis_antarctica.AAC.3
MYGGCATRATRLCRSLSRPQPRAPSPRVLIGRACRLWPRVLEVLRHLGQLDRRNLAHDLAREAALPLPAVLGRRRHVVQGGGGVLREPQPLQRLHASGRGAKRRGQRLGRGRPGTRRTGGRHPWRCWHRAATDLCPDGTDGRSGRDHAGGREAELRTAALPPLRRLLVAVRLRGVRELVCHRSGEAGPLLVGVGPKRAGSRPEPRRFGLWLGLRWQQLPRGGGLEGDDSRWCRRCALAHW